MAAIISSKSCKDGISEGMEEGMERGWSIKVKNKKYTNFKHGAISAAM